VSVGRDEGSGSWSLDTAIAVLQAVSTCRKLVTLTIKGMRNIRDDDLEPLLVRLSNLKCFTLTGAFGDAALHERDIGQLTAQALRSLYDVARVCSCSI
jgi:hypothetical protein